MELSGGSRIWEDIKKFVEKKSKFWNKMHFHTLFTEWGYIPHIPLVDWRMMELYDILDRSYIYDY